MSRMQGKSGGKGSVAAKGSETKSTANQPVTAPEASENISAHGPDNNKRLAALEADLAGLVEKLTTMAGFDLVEGENPIELAGKIVEGFAKYQSDGGELHEILLHRAGFVFGEGETCFGAAMRVIADLDAKAEEASPGELAAIKRAEEAEAKHGHLSDQLRRLGEVLLARGTPALDEGAADCATRVIGELDALIASLTADIEAQRQVIAGERSAVEADVDPGAERLAQLVAVQAENFTALPKAAAFTLVFADGAALLDLPPRSVSLEEISRDGERGVYDRRLTFSPAGTSHNLTAAWLVATDPASGGLIGGARCEIPGGLRVGGGAQAAIPAGHLIF